MIGNEISREVYFFKIFKDHTKNQGYIRIMYTKNLVNEDGYLENIDKDLREFI